MKSVVFHILHSHSHLNATFKLARKLKNSGYRILYFNFNHLETYIISQGFEFYPIPNGHYPKKSKNERKVWREMFQRKNYYKKQYLSGDFYDRLLKDVAPDLIIVDSSLIYYGLFLYCNKVSIVIACTTMCLNQDEYVPPIVSDYIPRRRNVLIKLYTKILWEIYFFKKLMRELISDYRPDKISHYHLSKQFLRNRGIRMSKLLNIKRASHYIINNVPELIFSPAKLDIPRNFTKNQFHLGLSVDNFRTELEPTASFMTVLEPYILRKGSFKIVYCALGSCTYEFVSSRKKFYLRLINIFQKNKNIILFLSTGNNIHSTGLGGFSENVHLFETVPQLLMLKYTDLMINHGGMQSVTECIDSEVPMICFPLQKGRFDQSGISSRIEFLNIGLKGNIQDDSEKIIETKINQMLYTDLYKNNIKSLRNTIIQDQEFEKSLIFLKSIMEN